MALWFWLKRPRLAVARVRYWLWEKANPDKPWMCPGTVRFCQTHLSKSMSAIEFGSGRSTRWFAERVGRLISIEHNPQWYAQVQKQLEEVKNVDYRLIPLNHPESEPERAEYSPVPDYVAIADALADRSIDFAVVDGHYRTHCVRHLIPKIAAGGYLLVDDINLWPSPQALPVPAHWPIVDDSTNGIKRCIIWQAADADPSRNSRG
ncbi:MAG: class I SAM-dependent methyltransferase [Phycisphaerae bacterium]|nr:class I SAM-dependent methyltransferase [Phycisphaerae bacterium]MDW8262321.1 class I SAM-dependent methyltransferase [Phycisphaerales bacterium]